MKFTKTAGTLGLGLLVLTMGGQSVFADADSKAAQDAELFASLDGNADGQLTSDEVAPEKERFLTQLMLRGDTDKNGSLSQDEFVLALNQDEAAAEEAKPEEAKTEEAKPEETKAEEAKPVEAKPAAEKTDTNKAEAENTDKKAEKKKAKEEGRKKARQGKPEGKKGNKGKGKQEGVKAMKPEGKGRPGFGRMKPPAPEEIIKHHDKDEDGKLTGEEIPERMQRMLKEGQTEVTADDLKAAFEQMKERMQAHMKARMEKGEGKGDRKHGMRGRGDHRSERGHHRYSRRGHGERGHGDRGYGERGDRGRGHWGRGDRGHGSRYARGHRDSQGRGYGHFSGRGHRGGHYAGMGRGPGHFGRFSHHPPTFEGGLLNTLDTNEDKKLSKEELSKAAEMFAELDKDEDGQVSIPELIGKPKIDHDKSEHGRRQGRMGKRDGHHRGEGRMGMHHRGMRGGKGMHGRKQGKEMEKPEGRGPRMSGKDRAEGFFKRLDKDEDGKLSEAELPERMKERLAKLDKDSDGTISKEEFKSPRGPKGEKGPKGKKGKGSKEKKSKEDEKPKADF
ncbi:EF hand [Polystyrenella longa]|uniref:EF hand n=1 Tax=Polystyrenella longa TaxID=2528007 RepID=A0A518CNN1_9PLAN|nr:hypothetical protein [Polystyrenella longa]QDU80832.1 EF hand [Polystyrenella longa]